MCKDVLSYLLILQILYNVVPKLISYFRSETAVIVKELTKTDRNYTDDIYSIVTGATLR
jgi:DNA topoisomerase IA